MTTFLLGLMVLVYINEIAVLIHYTPTAYRNRHDSDAKAWLIFAVVFSVSERLMASTYWNATLVGLTPPSWPMTLAHQLGTLLATFCYIRAAKMADQPLNWKLCTAAVMLAVAISGGLLALSMVK